MFCSFRTTCLTLYTVVCRVRDDAVLFLGRLLLFHVFVSEKYVDARKWESHFSAGTTTPRFLPLEPTFCSSLHFKVIKRVQTDVSWVTLTSKNARMTKWFLRFRARTRTHRPICNTYCFSTAKMVSWTRLYVTLYVRCLSCLLCHCWNWERHY
jgi:hypothetical protein